VDLREGFSDGGSDEMSDVEVLGTGVVEITVEASPVVEIEASSTPTIEIEVLPGGVSYGGVLSLEMQLVLGRLVSQPSLHKVLTYSDGDLTAIAVYADSTLDTQLLGIEFTYDNGDLVEKKLTDIISGKVLTVTYSYSSGNLISINEVFS
jgi:hypothetical protein